MNRILFCLVAVMLQLSAPAPATADAAAIVQSLPYAISSERLYKVRIERIDGNPVAPATNYVVSPGEHEFEVSLMLRIEWTSEQGQQQGNQSPQRIRLQVAAGKRYQLAARVDTAAGEEQVERGAFWQPVVYDTSDLP